MPAITAGGGAPSRRRNIDAKWSAERKLRAPRNHDEMTPQMILGQSGSLPENNPALVRAKVSQADLEGPLAGYCADSRGRRVVAVSILGGSPVS